MTPHTGPLAFDYSWPRLPLVLDYVAQSLESTMENTWPEIQEMLVVGRIRARGPRNGGPVVLIPAVFWRYAIFDFVGRVFDPWINDEAPWIEVSAEDALRIWPTMDWPSAYLKRLAEAPHSRTVSKTDETPQPIPRNKGGRPSIHDWPSFHAWIATYIHDNGFPGDRGDQAELERRAADWFPTQRQPSESQIRQHISRAITARKTFDGGG